jgi:acetyl esterase
VITAAFEELLASLEAAPLRDESNGCTTARLTELDPSLTPAIFEDHSIAAPAEDVTVRFYLPGDAPPRSILVWAHGGGFVGGSLDMPEAHWVGLALASHNIAVVSVDYHRVLHGNTFPVPSDDLLAAYRWTSKQRESRGFGSVPVHVGGASAGANLAAGVVKRLSRAGELPASAVLVFATLHPRLSETAGPDGPSVMLTDLFERTMLHFAGAAGVEDEIAFPANGAVPEGHPRTLFLDAETDLLKASSDAYAASLVEPNAEPPGAVGVATVRRQQMHPGRRIAQPRMHMHDKSIDLFRTSAARGRTMIWPRRGVLRLILPLGYALGCEGDFGVALRPTKESFGHLGASGQVGFSDPVRHISAVFTSTDLQHWSVSPALIGTLYAYPPHPDDEEIL